MAGPVSPNLGILGAVGLALQTTVGTFAAPTLFMKATGGSDVQPDYVWAREEFKDGNLFQNASAMAGITYQGKNFTVIAEAAGLNLLAKAMFATSASTTTAVTAQTVTIGATPVAPNATSAVVTALTAILPAYSALTFPNGVTLVSSASAASGATSVPIFSAPAAVATGQAASVTASSIITPRAAEDWDVNTPGVPVSMEQQVPNQGVKVTDAQITDLEIKSNGRTNPFDMTVTYSAVSAVDLSSPTSVVLPTVLGFTFRDVSVSYNGALIRPESMTLKLTAGVDPLDSLNGSNFIDGFERNKTGFACTGSLTLQAHNATVRAAWTGHTRAPIIVTLQNGSKKFRVIIPVAEVTTYTTPAGMDRIQPVVNFEAVTLDGTASFVIDSNPS